MDFDVIVIGSGAGGGVAAWVFAEAGRKVLVIERGLPADTKRDHLRNHRFSQYGHNTGPNLDGFPRTFVDEKGGLKVVRPHEPGYNNVAMALGGGTSVYGAQAWRFHPHDFEMASVYGVPGGSSLADWPISYGDLEPFYEEIEQKLGVCGTGPAATMPPRKEYPMPRLSPSPRTNLLGSAADRLGWTHQSVPLMINSVPFGGRPACLRCFQCVGFTCPNDSRASTVNTTLAWGEQAGNLEVWTDTMVSRLITDSAGKVVGVECHREGKEIVVKAHQFVVAAGAIETTRLLLNSTSNREPMGIGNNTDQVGRHLQGHYYPGAFGQFEEPVNDFRGPGPSISVLQFNHGNEGVIGGGMLADDFYPIPAVFARDYVRPGEPQFGAEFKEYIRYAHPRTFRLTGPVQDIPNPESRVQLDPTVKDIEGIPVARLSGTTHPETVRTSEFMRAKAQDWLREAGAKDVWSFASTLHMSAGQHQAGTCRMGNDDATSVVAPDGRVHGHENLLVCDASVHVTNGGFNPYLTVMATSLRTARLNI